ncbi:quinoprotein, partial [Thioclava sp. BHET1]
MKGTRAIAILACAGGLAACAPKPLILKGPRFDTRTPIAEVMADAGKGGNGNVEQVVPNRAEPVSLGAPVANADWTQRNGNAEHNFRQPALNGPLRPLWAAKIGKGNDKRNVITAAPVVAGGRVFTLDSIGNVTATATSGARLWSAGLTPPGESAKSLSGGGLAYGDGKIFATSAYGELVAMDPA